MIFRAFLIIINTLLVVFTYQTTDFFVTPTLLVIILILQVFEIFLKERKNRNNIIAYLESLILDETSNINP